MEKQKTMTQEQINALAQKLIPTNEMHPASVADVLNLPSFLSKIKACEQRFGRPFAQLDDEMQQALIFRRTQQLVQVLRVNPLWKDRLEKLGVYSYPETPEQWQQLPIMEREDLSDLYMGKRPGMVVPLSHGHFQIIASGGTSGGLPIETVYSISELRDTYELAGVFFDRHILPAYLNQPDTPKWMLTTLTDYEMWSSGSMLGGVLQNIPSVNFIHAGPMSPRTYGHVMSFEGPKAVLGMSREIEGLIDLGKDLPLSQRSSFKVAFYGSGILPARKMDDLKAVYPDIQILSYFASNQAEAIGIQLKPDSPLVGVPGLHLIEIVDENGMWVAQGEEGELVITRLHANAAPILRMKLGDRMIRHPNTNALNKEKANGLCATQFEFAGRSSDIIHLGESHYSGPRALGMISEQVTEQTGWDLLAQAHELQFHNNRTDKILTLRLAVDNVSNQLLGGMTKAQIRSIFVNALGQSLSVFDQTEQQLTALNASAYQFELELVALESSKIHRTGVNKTPLIKDSF